MLALRWPVPEILKVSTTSARGMAVMALMKDISCGYEPVALMLNVIAGPPAGAGEEAGADPAVLTGVEGDTELRLTPVTAAA